MSSIISPFQFVLVFGLASIAISSELSQPAGRPFLRSPDGFTANSQLPAAFMNASTPLSSQHVSPRDLFGRQDTCDPGYSLCADGLRCCPYGETCGLDGCCDAGTIQCSADTCYDPSTSICCPNGYYCPLGDVCLEDPRCCSTGKQACGTSYCYDPVVEQCCGDQGSCSLDYTCCTYECCKSGGYCAADGYCAANTCTVTETETFTSTDYLTTTITKFTDAASASKFSCFPLSAINAADSTLKLGSDCGLTLLPPATATSSPNFAAAAAVAAALAVRAESTCLITDTEFATATVTTPTTLTETTTSTTTPAGFSCFPMTVTDVDGDTLALDSKCQLKYSPASSAAAAASSPATEAATSTATGSESMGTSGIISGAPRRDASSSALRLGLLAVVAVAVAC